MFCGVRWDATVPHPVRSTTATRLTDRTPTRVALGRSVRAMANALTPTATARNATVHTWASLVAAKARQAAAVPITRGQVARRVVQIRAPHTTANRLIDRDSESTDRFHSVTGKAEAKARITHTATTRRQPGATSRPTVQARKPQDSAAI